MEVQEIPWKNKSPRRWKTQDKRKLKISPGGQITTNIYFKNEGQGFPGGSVVKDLPANAADMGLSPGPGRSHMPQSNKARVPQLLSLHSRAHEPQLLSLHAAATEAHTPRAHAPQQEKPPQWEAHAPQWTVALTHRN